MTLPMYGVYRVLNNGDHEYVGRSATFSKKLAEEIARDFTNGIAVRPDGSECHIVAHPHIAKEIAR